MNKIIKTNESRKNRSIKVEEIKEIANRAFDDKFIKKEIEILAKK